MPCSVHFGAGALGRGLVVPRLVAAGWSVAVVDPLPELLAALRSVGGYALEMREGGAVRRLWVPVAAALHPSRDAAEVAARLAEAPLVTTAVRKENLSATVATLAAAWEAAMPPRVSVVGCENVERVDEVLGGLFSSSALPADRRARLDIPRTVVDRICASDWPASTTIRTEPYTELSASPQGPAQPGIDAARDIDAVFDRKRYLVNTLADAAAILGLARGDALLSEAFGDAALLDDLEPLLAALKHHLALLHGFSMADLDAYAQTSRRRLADTFIPRRLDTVARDIWRKMQPGERFFAPLIDLQRRGTLDAAALDVMARLVSLGDRLEGPGDPVAERLRALAGPPAQDPARHAVYVGVADRAAVTAPL